MTDAERDQILALLERLNISPARLLQLAVDEMRDRLTQQIEARSTIVQTLDEITQALADENVQIDAVISRVSDQQDLIDQLEANATDPDAVRAIAQQIRDKTSQIQAALDPNQPNPDDGTGTGGGDTGGGDVGGGEPGGDNPPA